MADPKAKPPPPTQVLSVTKHPIDADDPTPAKDDFAPTPPVEPVPPEPPVEPETPPQEPLEPPFAIDDEPPPDEPPPDQDPQITEAKRKMHEATQELAQNKKLLDAVLRQRELDSMTPQAPGSPGPPPEFFSTKPTAEELADPNFFEVYTTRRMEQENFRRAQGEMVREMRDFVDQNKDWQTYYPTMQEIKNEDPYGYQGPGSVKSLYKRAKQQVEFQNLQAKLTEIQGQGVQAGAQIQQTKTSRPFATPRAGGGAGVPQKKGQVPANFASMSTVDQKEALKAAGLWKDDNF